MIARAAPCRLAPTKNGEQVEAFPLRSITVVGTGVSGWLAAAALRRVLGESTSVTLLAPADDNAINGAVAAVPSFHRLLGPLGIDERSLMRATQATYRLGTRFRDWGAIGDSYFQGFGSIGAKLDAVPFQHHWLRLGRSEDRAALEEFSMAAQIARLGRFAPPQLDSRSVQSLYSYAWHFDAKLLAEALRGIAMAAGVTHCAGEVGAAEFDANGCVSGLVLGDGHRLRTDFLVDSSGGRSPLAAQLRVVLQDWSAWLPCDRIQTVSVPCGDALPPHSDACATVHGWRSSTPLQHATWHGQVYCSEFIGDAEVADELAAACGAAAGNVRVARLLRGRPREFCVGNCLFMPGEALDPLESTGLHLAQTGIMRLLAHFPVRPVSPTDRAEYNRLTGEEYDHIRDLLILHYHATARRDSPFWQRCALAPPPESLARRLALFADSARLSIGEEEHCGADGWLAVLLGQGVSPRSYDPLADETPLATASGALADIATQMRSRALGLPLHREFIAQHGVAAARPDARG